MLTEVMAFYGLIKEFRRAGYYETDHLHQLFKEIKAAIHSGKLICWLVAVNPVPVAVNPGSIHSSSCN